MREFLSLVEWAREAYPAEMFADQILSVLGSGRSSLKGWRTDIIPPVLPGWCSSGLSRNADVFRACTEIAAYSRHLGRYNETAAARRCRSAIASGRSASKLARNEAWELSFVCGVNVSLMYCLPIQLRIGIQHGYSHNEGYGTPIVISGRRHQP